MRGGASVGPIDSDMAVGIGKTLAGVTVGSAVLEKYGGMAGTTLSSAMSSDLFTTNAVIAVATYCTGCLSSSFNAVEATAALWIASVVLKLKDAGVNEASIKANVGNIAVAAVLGTIAFVE